MTGRLHDGASVGSGLMKLVCLDTQIWTNLLEARGSRTASQVSAILGAVRTAARSGRCGCVVNIAVFDELVRLEAGNRRLYRQILGLIDELAQKRMMRSFSQLAAGEIAARGPLDGLDGDAVYVTRDERRAILKAAGRRRFTAAVAKGVAERVSQFKSEEEARRIEVLALLGAPDIKEFRKLEPEINTLVDSWVLDHLRLARRSALPQDEKDWPRPSELPLIRGFLHYKIARIWLNVGEGRKINESDYYDAEHFACATYADFLVTEDKSFRETCRLAARPRPKVVDLDELVGLINTRGFGW